MDVVLPLLLRPPLGPSCCSHSPRPRPLRATPRLLPMARICLCYDNNNSSYNSYDTSMNYYNTSNYYKEAAPCCSIPVPPCKQLRPITTTTFILPSSNDSPSYPFGTVRWRLPRRFWTMRPLRGGLPVPPRPMLVMPMRHNDSSNSNSCWIESISSHNCSGPP
jgi:hypothetical protein